MALKQLELVAPTLVVVATMSTACGPTAGSHHSADSTTATVATDTTTVASNSGNTSETEGDACVGSELPHPFCHERIVLSVPSFDNPIILPISPLKWKALAFQSYSPPPASINLFDAQAMIVTATVPSPDLNGAEELFRGDFNGDGALDIAITGSRDEIPTFRSPDLASLGAIPSSIGFDGLPTLNNPAFGFDVDRDGQDELLAGTGPWFDVWKRGDDWTLIGNVIVDACNAWHDKRGDIDGDGTMDLLTYGADCPEAEHPYDSEWDVVVVFHSATGATTMEAQRFPTGLRSLNVIPGDYDGDGHDDIMAIGGWENIALLHGRADGSLGDPSFHSLGDLAYDIEASTLSEILAGNDTALSGDFDGNGIDEVVVTIPTGEEPSSTLILISLVEQGLTSLDLQKSVTALAVDDINDDGRSDILAIDGVETFAYLSIP